MWYYFKEKFEDIKVVIQRRTCITMAKRKKSTKGQTMVYKALRRKLRFGQDVSHKKNGDELRCFM